MDGLIVALFVLGVAWVGMRRRGEPSSLASLGANAVAIAVAVLVAFSVAAILVQNDVALSEAVWQSRGGFMLGGLVVAFGVAQLWSERDRSLGSWAVGILAGAMVLSAFKLLDLPLAPESLAAFAAGAAMITLCGTRSAAMSGLSVALIPLVSLFAEARELPGTAQWACLAITVPMLLATILHPMLGNRWSEGVVAVGLGLLAAVAIAIAQPDLREVGIILVLAFAGSIVVSLGTRQDGPLEATIAGLISVGLGTAAFALSGGLGISVATLAFATALLALGSSMTWASLTPIAALLGYRVVREFTSLTARSPDLGVQYAVTGLLIGASFVALMAWSTDRKATPSLRFGAIVLWTLTVLGFASVLRVVLGVEAMIGMLVGTSVSGWVVVRQGAQSSTTPGSALAIGLGAAVFAPYFAAYGAVARDVKQTTLIGTAIFLVVLGVIVARSKSAESAS